jgi:tripartite-type tricarboxylate transporter receptor subunit TctC
MPEKSEQRLAAALLTSTLGLFAFGCQAADADSYPDHPVRLIVGFAAGGATDLQARMLAEGLTKLWGKTVIPENRPGASGGLAAEMVARSAPDGYTLLADTAGALTIRPHLEKVNYDTLKDFIPITAIATNDAVIMVSENFPAKTFPEFIAVVKAAPGRYGYGTSGQGSITMLGMEALKKKMGFDIVHVPYKGDSQAMLDLMGGHIPIALPAMPSVTSQLSSGKVRAIATLGEKRLKLFPNLPTVAEYGYSDQICSSWIGILGVAGTPDAIVQKINRDIRKVVDDPKFVAALEQGGSRSFDSSVAQFTAFVKNDIKVKGDIIKSIGLKLD